MKITAAAGALALIALVPTPAQAQTADPAFEVQANRSFYNVVCRDDDSDTVGTAPVRLRVTSDDTPATRWVATWLGSSGGSIIMTTEGQYFSATTGATFPCPPQAQTAGRITISVQAFDAQDVAVGDPITIQIQLRRVASASGPSGPGVTEVLGLRLGAPDGPTPVGGIRTGAGGTSPRSSGNPLLPVGAGLGFAGLAAGVMIRRRRCSAV